LNTEVQLIVRKKIAFIANTAWSMYNFRKGLLKTLVAKKIDVYVLAPYDNYVASLESLGVIFVPITRLAARGFNPFGDCRLLLEFKKALKSLRPDLVFTYTIKPNIYGVVASKLVSIPVVAVITGLGYGLSKGGLLTRIVKLLYSFSLKNAEKVWFLNTDDLHYFKQNQILDEGKMQLIPGEGVDTMYFRRTIPFPDDRPPKFLYAGRLLYDKGVEDFVKAIALLKEKGLNVTGALLGFTDTANPTAITRKTVHEWEAEGIIEYWGNTDDVRPFLEKVNCLVFPSYYSEGIPRCLLEAGSMEVPSITTDNVGCREVVSDGQTGYLVAPRDIDSLAHKLEDFVKLSNDEKRNMGKRARTRVEALFSERQVLEMYYRQIAAFPHLKEIECPV